MKVKAISGLLSRFRPQTFRIQYSSHHVSFLPHHVASDPQHPLCTLRRREQSVRKHEGLWWTVTSGVDLSKSSVVRSSCRRRLRTAVVQSLRARGFDEFGHLVDHDALLRVRRDLAGQLDREHALSLTGSTRLHIMPPLLATKYLDLRTETDSLMDILLEEIKGRPPRDHHSPDPARPKPSAKCNFHPSPSKCPAPVNNLDGDQRLRSRHLPTHSHFPPQQPLHAHI
ncbi:hypothetical protein GRF29_19g2236268 [Pseudopithomyces chartarum]|uniref:Uncharacterized protein n=1 Tax=Pseudopithomyces chartarum TaxID=1892770 RepID=A0AAN6M4K6_9PLEO|nr:hypothetical protein GRF29_19g2236268 [Pseudopithomyces chartarum]